MKINLSLEMGTYGETRTNTLQNYTQFKLLYRTKKNIG